MNSAGKRRLSIKEFVIEIWENAVNQDIHDLAFSSLLLESVTGLQGEACFTKIDEMIKATLLDDLETTQTAITFMAEGLVEYQKPLT